MIVKVCFSDGTCQYREGEIIQFRSRELAEASGAQVCIDGDNYFFGEPLGDGGKTKVDCFYLLNNEGKTVDKIQAMS